MTKETPRVQASLTIKGSLLISLPVIIPSLQFCRFPSKRVIPNIIINPETSGNPSIGFITTKDQLSILSVPRKNKSTPIKILINPKPGSALVTLDDIIEKKNVKY